MEGKLRIWTGMRRMVTMKSSILLTSDQQAILSTMKCTASWFRLSYLASA